MYKLSLCLIGLFVFTNKMFFSCGKTNPSNVNSQKINCIQVSYNQPIFDSEGTMFLNKSSYTVYYYEHFIMYGYLYFFDSTHNGEFILKEQPRKSFFIYHKDSLFGYNYDPNPNKVMPDNKRLPVDSLKKKISLESSNMDGLLQVKADSSIIDQPDGILKQVYKYPATKENIYGYTMFLYFDKKLNKVCESFSRKLDSARSMKLFRIHSFFDEVYIPHLKKTLPQREGVFEMNEIPVENAEEIMGYFNRYKERINKGLIP